jgi:acetyl esterase/lipase
MKHTASAFGKRFFFLLTAVIAVMLIAAGCMTNPQAPYDAGSPLVGEPVRSDPPIDNVKPAPADFPRSYTDVRYGPEQGRPGYHVRQVLDLKLPATGEGPWPLIMYIHGGAFTGGDKGSPDAAFSGYSARGYALADIRYRLASSSAKAFPEAVQDALAAIRHLRANALEYRLDTTRFAAAGFSAGGYFTAIVCALSGLDDDDPDLAYFIDSNLGNTHVSSKVQAAASAAALSDFTKMAEQQAANPDVSYMITPGTAFSPEGQFLGGAFMPVTNDAVRERLERSNPLRYLNANTPPIIMRHATNDNLLPWQQSKIMADAINDITPGRAVYYQVTTGGHAGWAAGEANMVFEFLNAAMPGGQTGILEHDRIIPR